MYNLFLGDMKVCYLLLHVLMSHPNNKACFIPYTIQLSTLACKEDTISELLIHHTDIFRMVSEENN